MPKDDSPSDTGASHTMFQQIVKAVGKKQNN